jgi:DNA helicase II / ATP-dependent DNA helicase PcrA
MPNRESGYSFVPSPQQNSAIKAGADEQLLVVAGPGTGKTQVTSARLLHLLRSGLRPAQVLVLSFSRSAVATLLQRMIDMAGEDELQAEDVRYLAVRTFDSWTFRMLRQSGLSVEELLSGSHEDNIKRLTRLLVSRDEAVLARLGGVRHVMVDEFQDLAGSRSDLVVALLDAVNEGRRVGFTVLGDPAQAIYGFASGDATAGSPSPWEAVRKRFGGNLEEISLTRNYRSTEELAMLGERLRDLLDDCQIDAEQKAAAVRAAIEGLPPGFPEGKAGPQWLETLPDGKVAVLTRTNGEALQFWQMLLGKSATSPVQSVKLRVTGAPLFVPGWVSLLLSGFKPSTISRSVFSRAFEAAARRAPDVVGSTGLPPEDTAWIRLARASGAVDSATEIDLDELRKRMDWPDSFPDDQNVGSPGILISTIHQSKGMEFDKVVLLEQRERDVGDTPNELEEAFVGFVAVTRAALQLCRISSDSIYAPLRGREFRGGRTRQHGWGKMNSFQIGLHGDVDPVSFVSTGIHGSPEAVAELQEFLAGQVAALRGRKVSLHKSEDSKLARDVRYAIKLQGENESDPGMLLGSLSAQVTYDLLEMLWNAGYSLPKNIYNLRIDSVVSVSASEESVADVPQPWRSSRLWFGVSLIGAGSFKTWRRNVR